VKAQAAEREKWSCDKCRTERMRMLEEELHKALRQIDELKARNRKLEEKLLLAGGGKKDIVPTEQKAAKCVVVGDSMVRNVGTEHTDMKVECFPGLKLNSYAE
jgi:undecaprenyl pyrophosphate synthase